MQGKIPYLESWAESEESFMQNEHYIIQLESGRDMFKSKAKLQSEAQRLKDLSRSYGVDAFLSGVAAVGTAAFSRKISKGFLEDLQIYLGLRRRCAALESVATLEVAV